MESNFQFLSKYWPELAEIGSVAESYLFSDPNACVFKIGLLSERIVSRIMLTEKIPDTPELTHAERIRILQRENLLPRNIDDILFAIRKARNDAVHSGESAPQKAHTLLRMSYNLCVWFMEVYGDWNYTPQDYIEPTDHSSDADFRALLLKQEERINQLSEQMENLSATPLSSAPEERSKQAMESSDKLKLSAEETNYLIGEQVRLDISALSVVNYALQQNKVPIIQEITVVNKSDHTIENVDLRITATADLCIPYSKHLDLIPANEEYHIKDVQLILNGGYLSGLTEKVSGTLHVYLVSEDQSLYSENIEITALAFDEWQGYTFYPELIAAFVTPNHPEVTKINIRAADMLGKWTGDPSLDAYQTKDAGRVLAQAAAIYGALQEQNIVYAVPPASFERTGQRVRLCDAVMQQKMGTCLDLTLFYASCLEAGGLHPILILKSGHIFAGVWLDDLAFPEPVQYDTALVTKRLASGINEIAVVECTAFVSGKNVDFDAACATAERELLGENPVECIVDVNRARLSGVSPLPSRIQTENGWYIERPKAEASTLTAAPKNRAEPVVLDEQKTPEEFSKKVQWERKLLDLGLRNALINMHLSKTMVPVLSSSLDRLEDALSDGSDFSILPRPADWRTMSSEVNFENIHDLGATTEIIQSEFKNRRLRSAYTENELAKAIKELYRASKAALEENGANTLYLALGLLRWYETNRSTKPRYAPVVLIPIEMARKSAAQGYVIRLRDDEPQINITMLEKLKQDFGIIITGLDPLPQDEHGIDTRKIFTILRKSVMEQSRWDVLESAYLGIFSFSQFVMWNDIRNRSDDLARNKIVRSLMDGKLSWDARDMQIERRVPEDHVFLPIPADASQLFAIEAACQGESFVLHGPPGTGKSQTITALIANALAQGRTVLFVAEKMAALSVVQKRLTAIGIEPFCLELHSNKSKKKDVLEQLRQATEVTKYTTAEAYEKKSQQMAEIRAELDVYASGLHQKLSCGMSLFNLIERYEESASAADIKPFGKDFAKTATRDTLEKQEAIVARLVASAKEVGHPHTCPLQAVRCSQYSQAMRGALPAAVQTYQKALAALEPAGKTFANSIGCSAPSTFHDIERIASVSKELTIWLDLPSAWAKAENLSKYLREVQEMAQHCLNADTMQRQLSETWSEDFLTQDGKALHNEYDTISEKWFLPKALEMRGLSKRLAVYSKKPVEKDELAKDFALLEKYQAEKAAAEGFLHIYQDDLEHLYAGNSTNWKQIQDLAENAKESDDRLRNICMSEQARLQYGGRKELQQIIFALCGAWNELLSSKDSLYSLLKIKEYDQNGWIANQQELCDSILENVDSLKEWITWNSICEEAARNGLQNVVDAYLSGLAHEEITGAYRKAIFKALAENAIDENSALNTFSGAVFNEKIEQFKRAEIELTSLTQQEIFCRLAARVPNFAKEAAQSSELGILQRAIRSNGRGMSIRKLFEQLPNLLPRLCPCMLMSPISAAQYLDPNREPFDLIVFDEASQLPTCKAVGALARGRNAVIVGDPKQMPPTSFFATNVVDEDNLDVEDLESILDDCLALNMPQTHLLWHYRSRHESLIAFSNSQFYENKLYTFPSVNDLESKVSLVHVDGVFERGKARQNRAEAEAVVGELVRRCHDSTLPQMSVGVVTFNVSQQNLIDDLLTEACKTDAELEAWAYEAEEPVFIKNLENVQGDERDVILFSIGYGPDEAGKVYMNYGPLNREGGWRRLNVAVSRARCEMVVFSTLTPDQINLTKTSAGGVAALKAFLEYADGHKLLQDENTIKQSVQPREGIAETICGVLKEHGYETHTSVGHSEYRIDIGVVDPQNPNQYLLGILLDGANYEKAKTTYDREIAQINVLNGLGWHVLRVWTMDWWDNHRKELNRILDELKRLRSMPERDCSSQEETVKRSVPPSEKSMCQDEAVMPQRLTENHTALMSKKEPLLYSPTRLTVRVATADEFIEPSHYSWIRDAILAVIAHEAPISEEMLTHRVVQSFGIARSGSRIQARMNQIYKSLQMEATIQGEQRFYWASDQQPEMYRGFRVSGEGELRREAKDVPVQEAANAIVKVLADQISLSQDDLVREAANLMGYSRMGGNVVSTFLAAIRYAEENERIAIGANGNWKLLP